MQPSVCHLRQATSPQGTTPELIYSPTVLRAKLLVAIVVSFKQHKYIEKLCIISMINSSLPRTHEIFMQNVGGIVLTLINLQ